MADILTLADARLALRKAASDVSDDADLLATYIPAVTPIVEDMTGPIIQVAGQTWTVDGGKTTIMLPTACVSVQQVTENGTVLVANVDYTVNLRSGLIVRGSVQQPYIFLSGQQNIVITYTAGTGVIPVQAKLAARLILVQLWRSDQQGLRPALGAPDTDTVSTPSGFAIPKRAYALLKSIQNLPGFA